MGNKNSTGAPQGPAIVRMHAGEKTFAEWTYIEMGFGPKANATHLQYDGNFLQHGDFVLDVAWGKMEVNNVVNLVKGPGGNGANGFHTTRKSGGGRDFIKNADGTISPKLATHLVLGAVHGNRLGLVNKGDQNAYNERTPSGVTGTSSLQREMSITEFYHGTSLEAALAIQDEGFDVSRSGSNAGMNACSLLT